MFSEPSQVCSCCRERRPLSHFYRRKSGMNGHKAGTVIDFCKWCAKDRAKARNLQAQASLQAQVAAQPTWTQPIRITLEEWSAHQTRANMARSREIGRNFRGRTQVG